jgi:tetratricopeptide (TPR) repeat protein
MHKTMRLRVAMLLVMLFLLLVACSRREPVSPETPLFDNLGSHHHAITTSSDMAQRYFDQGMRLLFGFNHDESERSFREAARLDPDSAMAWWGVAVALGPNINLPLDAERNARALEAVAKAQSLLAGETDAERAYVAAIATRYSKDPNADRAKLDREYSEAMRGLSARYPNDNDAAVLYAESMMDLKPWQLWTKDGKPAEGTEEIVKILETVLAREPNHPGANHYYIHAIEASPNPEKGAASAKRLTSLLPGAGHLVHMPAHIFMRTGDYRGAAAANADAVRADEAYFARTKVEGVYPMMYYTHNFLFLSAAAGMSGRSAEAIDAAGKAVAVVAPMASHMPMAEYVLPWSLFAMARSGKWDDILAYPRPADSNASTVAFWHHSRGLAHIAKGDLNAARVERKGLDQARMNVSKDFLLNLNLAHDLIDIAALVLDARLASAEGDRNRAIASWKKAISIEDKLNYDEPPAWYYPVRESLGAEHLRSRQFKEAEQVFRSDLALNPNNPRSLFGLREALKGQGRDSSEVNRQFEEGWKGADIPISVNGL